MATKEESESPLSDLDDSNFETERKPEVIIDEKHNLLEGFQERIQDLLKGLDPDYGEYDVAKEKPPRLPIYHPVVPRVLETSKNMINDAMSVLKDSTYEDKETKRMLTQLRTQAQFEYPKPLIIGLIGDSGVGKSSLINSLLDRPGLAFEGSSGAACTSVITEYHYLETSQQDIFIVEIEFIDDSELRNLICKHFSDYYRHAIECHHGLSDPERDDLAMRSSTALETFIAIFADRSEFLENGEFDQDLLLEFLSRAKGPRDPAILGSLLEWARAMISNCATCDGKVKFGADTVDQVTATSEQYVRTVFTDSDRPIRSPWPLVKVVKVKMDSPLLKYGLVLTDLPGLSDVNLVRVRTTENYMRSCDFIYLVAAIARVQTDKSIGQKMMTKMGYSGYNKTLVCTKIDEGARVRPQLPTDLFPSEEDAEEYAALHEAKAFVEGEIKRCKAFAQNSKGQEKRQAQQNVQRMSDCKLALDALLKETWVEVRNKKVTKALKALFQRNVRTRSTLKVYCVSNEWYRLHLEGYDRGSIPSSVTASNIPRLRYDSLALPARSRFQSLQMYCSGRLELSLLQLEIWATATVSDRRDELRLKVTKPQEFIEETITTYSRELKDLLKEMVLHKIGAEVDKWIEAGVRVMEHWTETWHHSTIRAWCYHNGNHKSDVQSGCSWNAELLKAVRQTMDPEWKRFDDALTVAGEKNITELEKLVNMIRTGIQDTIGFDSLSMEPVLRSLGPRRTALKECQAAFTTQLRRESREIFLKLVEDHSDAFLPTAMENVYQGCYAFKGVHAAKARNMELVAAVKNGKPFATFDPQIRATFGKKIDKMHEKMVVDVQVIFDGIVADFDCQLVIEEVHDPRRDELREAMRHFVTDAKKTLNGSLASDLAQAVAESEKAP